MKIRFRHGWAAGLVLALAACAPDKRPLGPVGQPMMDDDPRLVTESEREIKKWIGYQVDGAKGPDILITGVVMEVSADYKSVQILLDDAEAKIEPGDIFDLHMRQDDFVKRNRRAEYHIHGFPTGRVRVTSVEGAVITAEIDHQHTLHPIRTGDRAAARTF